MTGRQKMEAAFSAAGSHQTPAVICYDGIYLRDHWQRLTELPWWYMQAPDLERQLQWQEQILPGIGQDWFCLPCFYSRDDRAALSIEQDGMAVSLLDRRTGRRRPLETEPSEAGWGTFHPLPNSEAGPKTTMEVDLAIPVAKPFDAAEFVASGRGDLARAMLERFGSGWFPIQHVCSPLWQCHSLWGYEGLMLHIHDHPELVRYACQRLAANAMVTIQQAAAVGVRGIWIEECFTDSIGPAAFAQFNVPMVRRLVQAIREAGMWSIYYYCGNPADRWDLLLACGADALSLEESKKGFRIDIEEVVARVGCRCAVLGNLDALDLLPHGSEAQLRQEIARQLTAGRRNGGRFVMSLGSPVTPQTSPQRVRFYCDCVHELGQE